jgi:hypothetical protein
MTVFIVFIAEIPSMYRKIEIRNEEFYGDDKLICDAMYVQKVIITTTDKIKSL